MKTKNVSSKKVSYAVAEYNNGNPHYTRIVDLCRHHLAFDFDIPALDILSMYGAKIWLSCNEMSELLTSIL